MPGDRLARLVARLQADGALDHGTALLCQSCASILAVTGAAILLMSGDEPQGTLCTSDAVSTLIEEVQFTLGEGPSLEAFERDQPVMEPELAGDGTSRWAAFAPDVVRTGARAVFAFPLAVGAARIGVLSLYRDAPGPLDDDQHADALVLAGVAARAVLDMQAGAPPGMLGAGLEASSDFRAQVHQASGMVSAQLEVSVAEALVRLRAHAFAHDRPLDAVAADVIARRLRLSDGPGGNGGRQP